MDIFIVHLTVYAAAFWLTDTGSDARAALLLLAALEFLHLSPLRLVLQQYFQMTVTSVMRLWKKFTNPEAPLYASILESETSFEARVWPGDVDFLGHMNNAQYL